MSAIVDKKSNLARGFADVNTPTKYEDELLFSLQEKREQVLARQKKIQEQINFGKPEDWTDGQWQDLKTKYQNNIELLGRIKKKAEDKANLQELLVARLKQVVPQRLFHQCVALAKQDRKRLLGQISIATLEQGGAE